MGRRKLVENTIRLYKNCSDLPIRRFDIIYRTKDLRYLCLEYDGYNEVEVPKEAKKRWEEIFDEWIRLCDDNTISYFYQLILEVTYLETRYLVSGEMLQQIFKRYPSAMSEESLDLYIAELKRWKYIFDKKNDYLDEIKKLLDQRRASENKLGLKKSELEEIRKEHGDSEPQTLEAQAIILEHITGIKTDLDKDSVLKWLETGKLATTINEQRRKENGK